VLGPTLWNLFFADVAMHAKSTGGSETLFADDLSVFQEFDKHALEKDITETLDECRSKVHRWGRIHRVLFDAGKEHLIVIHPVYGEGDPVKILGCLTDTKLVMDKAIDEILSRIRPRVTALLRTRAHYGEQAMIGQFKTHIWGIMENIMEPFFMLLRHYLTN